MKALIVLLFSASLFAAGCAHHRHHHCKGGCDHHRHHKGKSGHWKKMDADNDQTVTKAEFDKAHADMFTAMDANKDGKITKDEKKAFRKAKKEDCGCDEGKKAEDKKADDGKKTGEATKTEEASKS